jgi:Tripartite tricarboxylate transporter TctB family
MLIKALKRQDTLAGLLFLLFGAGALYIGARYPSGSAGVMGPGYFPRLLGGLLCIFGLTIAVKDFLKPSEEVSGVPLRPFLSIVAILLFGVLIPTGGLVIAIAALVIVGAASGSEFRIGEAVLVAVALCAFSVAVFNWGLGLHIPLWPAW